MIDIDKNIIEITDLGHMDYQSAWELQKDIQNRVIAGQHGDILFLVEHEPVYTLGKNADENHILQHNSQGIKTYHTERGGDVTYHGPGQLVGYPILDLNRYKRSVSWFMRSLEEVIIQTLTEFNITTERKQGLTGVWADDEKVAALGVRISRWVTMHGFALNIHTDLTHYAGIIPCGIFEYGVTSMSKLLNRHIDLDEVKPILTQKFLDIFQSEEN